MIVSDFNWVCRTELCDWFTEWKDILSTDGTQKLTLPIPRFITKNSYCLQDNSYNYSSRYLIFPGWYFTFPLSLFHLKILQLILRGDIAFQSLLLSCTGACVTCNPDRELTIIVSLGDWPFFLLPSFLSKCNYKSFKISMITNDSLLDFLLYLSDTFLLSRQEQKDKISIEFVSRLTSLR